ncbi:hypothetical protein C8R44DRAFT_867088 [Mycena epipterygia]|nr:hypothetical protein C8R44DRAFT_867088 [Mycena epipterygia]
MRDTLVSQLPPILLGSLSLIPNDALRYTLLVITTCLTLIYVIHLKRPSTQLHQLEDMIKRTDVIIRDATSYCARDLFHLAEKGVRLLEVKRSASMIHCRVLEANSNTLTWKKYQAFSRDIAECAKMVENIQTAVQLIVEAERQRKFTEDINETETILTSVRSPNGLGGVSVYQPNAHVHQQSYMPLSVLEYLSHLLADTAA